MSGFGSGLFGAGIFGIGSSPTRIPTIKVEIDATNKPTTATRVWTDVTSYAGVNRVRNASWVRSGRTRETEQTQPGSLQSLVLDNRDGIFDRLNTSGPFAGGLDWRFWIRISIDWGGVTYPRWTGVKASVPGSRPAGGRDRYVTLTGIDALSVLELFPLAEQDFASETTDARVTNVLALTSLMAGTIDPTGRAGLLLDAVSFAATDTTTAGAHLTQVETDERGLLYADATGAIQFQSAIARSDKLSAGPVATIGESDGDIRYVEADVSDESDYVFTDVAVTPTVGAIQLATSSAAVSAGFRQRLDISSLSAQGDFAQANAQWYANRFGVPLAYLPQLELIGGRDPATWPTILTADNSDVFLWEGGDNSEFVYLERVQESYTPGKPLKVMWDMAPAGRDSYWTLDGSDASTLDGANVFG
jgi:hypothetical protein